MSVAKLDTLHENVRTNSHGSLVETRATFVARKVTLHATAPANHREVVEGEEAKALVETTMVNTLMMLTLVMMTLAPVSVRPGATTATAKAILPVTAQ